MGVIMADSTVTRAQLSEAVYQEVKAEVDAVYYAEMNVKGRKQPVRTYELKWV